jgi:hypothetical protein
MFNFFKGRFLPPPDPFDDFAYRKALFKLLVVFVFTLVGVMQTERFVSFYLATEPAEVDREIERCTKYQSRHGNSTREKQIEVIMFEESQTQLKLVQDARDDLLSDEELQKEIKDRFGVSFREIGVVILPSWKIFFQNNNERAGITLEGWKIAKPTVGSPFVRGFTLHDQPGAPQRTKDERARIVLNAKAFQSAGTMRLTLLHELLHAINVPGRDPWPPSFAQNDLTYLPEYRALVKKKGLDGWDESLIWLLAVVAPGLIFVFLARRIWIMSQVRRANKLSWV